MAAYRSWQPGLNVVVGDFMEPANVLAFGFQCTFAGLTGTEEPDWSTAVTAGDTITDGAVTWTDVTAVTIEWTAENLSQTGSSEPVWSTTVDGTTGEGVRLKAGCRNFKIAEAIKHWQETRAGTPLGDESFILINQLVELAFHRGLIDQNCEAVKK